jgi:aminoglycoside phosphotransferase (APT) family kinase protein
MTSEGTVGRGQAGAACSAPTGPGSRRDAHIPPRIKTPKIPKFDGRDHTASADGDAPSNVRAGDEVDSLVDADALTRFLAAVPELRDALPIRQIERIGGGQSNVTCRVALADRDVIVRRPPPGPLPPRAHDVLREHRILSALAPAGAVPVPRPIAACDDPAVLGAPFFIMEALPGDAVRFELPPALAAAPDETRRSMGLQVADALAALHTTDPAAVGLGDLGPPSGYVPRQIKRWRGQLDHARVRPVPDLDWAADWLERHQQLEPAQVRIVHGDYRLDNVIFAPDPPPRLLGIVDWELATLGDPLADLGWLLAFWREPGDDPPDLKIMPRVMEQPGFPPRAELAARYAERVGQTLPDLKFYVVFAMWRMAVLLENHWARHLRGTAAGFDFGYLETAGPAFAARLRRIAEEAPTPQPPPPCAGEGEPDRE